MRVVRLPKSILANLTSFDHRAQGVSRHWIVVDFRAFDAMNLVHLLPPSSGGTAPRYIHYRDVGSGVPVLFLHGGWGYDIYPIDRQARAMAGHLRFITPDRTGYGKSSRPGYLGPGFHKFAAEEMFAFLDALGIDRVGLWGHSDGAVTAILMALARPERVQAVIAEAMHYDRRKEMSRTFFETMAASPEAFGEKVASVLSREHGESYWRELLQAEGRAWLELARTADLPEFDLYEGRLSQLGVPTLILHGSDDPRTEAGELDCVRRLIPAAEFHVVSGAGHSPHSERPHFEEVTLAIQGFLAGHY